MVGHKYSWEEETLIIDLYTRTPTSKINDKNPEIMALCNSLNQFGYDCVVSGIRNKMENLKSVDPDYTSDGRIGRKNAKKEFTERWMSYLSTNFKNLDNDVEFALKTIEKHNPDVTRPAIKRRDGQAVFRERVLASFDCQCCITKMKTPQLLQACHIKPHSVCIKENRPDQDMDIQNGLCMNILYHRAFDAGLFSIDEDKKIILSPYLDLKDRDSFFSQLEGQTIITTDRTMIGEQYLEYHRKNIFAKKVISE